ncbi:hypothetical protein BC829DRAFT_397178 [Chytridium lagenaria]|nr:hypothetical protein BC829DRAFT_397178 [Chytridium lagenaria]
MADNILKTVHDGRVSKKKATPSSSSSASTSTPTILKPSSTLTPPTVTATASPTKPRTHVVCMKRQNGVIVQDCDVYIGRAMYMGGWRLAKSIWFNPFQVKTMGRRKRFRGMKSM